MKIGRSIPDEYRLVKRCSEFVLQGGFHSVDYKTGAHEVEWRDMPTMTDTVKDQLEKDQSLTNDQITHVMLTRGSPEQKKEALRYIGIPSKNEPLVSTMDNRYLFVGYDRDGYAIVQDFLIPFAFSVWMLRDSDAEVELLTIEECDYERKYDLKFLKKEDC